MPRTEVRNTGFTTRVTKAPALCPHCHKAVSSAPAWMKIMSVLAPGRGSADPTYTLTAIANQLQRSPQQTLQMANEAITAGALEKDRSTGTTLYRRTRYGQQLLARWKSVGWREL